MWKKAMLATACIVLCLGGLAQAQDQTRTAAMVVSSTDLSLGFDQPMYDRLVAMGYEVTLVTTGDIGGAFTRDVADTYNLLLISESIGSSGADPLIGTTAPVMHNESYGWDNWSLTTGANMHWASGTSVDIVNNAHPIAAMAGVPIGPMTFFNIPASWTTDSVSALAPGAELIAQINEGGTNVAIIFAVDEGAQLVNGNAALNRIVGFSIPGNNAYGAADMTNETWALFDAAVNWLTRSALPTIAKEPSPADTATDVPTNVVLSWGPGESAHTHDVYLGTDFDDVNNGVALVSPGQDANSYDPGGLEFGQTYFWRIDEVNAPPDSTVFEGKVWSFTTELFAYPITDASVTASIPTAPGAGGPERTADGSGLVDGQHSTVDGEMWLGDAAAGGPVWIRYEFDQVYKLYEMHIWNHNSLFEGLIGLGAKSITIEYATGTDDWTILGDFEIARATGTDTYAGATIDLGGIAARSVRINLNSNWGNQPRFGLAEVRFFYIPVSARYPNPADGATGVSVDPTLSWRPGREATAHQVHISSDSDAVANGTALVDTVSDPTYSVGDLDLGTTYYWKIGEVNDAATPGLWEGPIWNFTTQESLVVDDFESYTGDEGQEVFSTWIDGYGVAANGSQAGHDLPPYVERTAVYDGGQSMPFHYGQDSASHSEVSRTFDMAQDWTRGGITTLTLYVQGQADNATGQFTVKVNGVAKSVDVDLTAEDWQEVNVELASLGVNLQGVTSLALSIDSAGSGMVLVDGIQLRP